MNKRKLAIGSAWIVVVLFAIFVATAPYITVYQMKLAAQRHDGAALSEHIEFPSVRQSLKDQLNVLLAKKAAEEKGMQDNPLGALGMLFAGKMVDVMVDAYVTPTAITQLMAGEKLTKDAITGIGGSDKSGQGNTGDKPHDKSLLSDASMSYESLNKFVVRIPVEGGGEGRFILRRHGLGWKVTEILLPLE